MTQALTDERVFTIAQAARSCGLAESTLRYYEQIGVLPPAQRDPANGYRVYTQSDLDLLDVVACLSSAGMPVADMREYIAGVSGGRPDPRVQLDLMLAQEARLGLEAEALEVRRRYVGLKVAFWRAVAAGEDARADRIGEEARELSESMRGLELGGRR
jgi:DNA-binding transcriptional MerR regulator